SDSDESVFVDEQGRLHLKIRKIGNKWWSAEVCSIGFTQHGPHIFHVASPLDNLDAHVVLGLFVFSTNKVNDVYPEIDFEATTWNNTHNGNNAQFVVQPYNRPNMTNIYHFLIDDDRPTTHIFDWQPSQVAFESFYGAGVVPATEDDRIFDDVYTGPDNPDPANHLRVHMNLWLSDEQSNSGNHMPANPNIDPAEIEVIISSVELPEITPCMDFNLTRPILLTPEKRAATNDATPLFTWSGVENVTYTLQLASDKRFTTIIQEFSGIVGTSFTPAMPLSDGQIFWRVRAVNCAWDTSAWSKSRDVTVDTIPPPAPNMLSPSDGETVVGSPRFLSWDKLNDVGMYEIRLDTHNPIMPNAILVTKNKYKLPGPLLPTTYFWQVRAKDEAGNWGEWTPVHSMFIQSSPNEALILNRFTTATPTLTWNNFSGAVRYEIQVSETAKFREIAFTAEVAALSITTPPLHDGVWYMRIRPKFADSSAGQWNSGEAFIIDTT
ncbi:MAG: hypothetical protein D6737_05730, partial [Chloroflexi bacterium]